MGMIELRLVKTKSQKELVKEIIETHHSYVPTSRSVGRRIDYLIYNVKSPDCFPPDEECIGMAGVGSSTYPPCKDLLGRLSISKYEYKDIFNNFANNWRFCLRKKIPNAASKILSRLCAIAKKDWKEKYGDDLRYMITYVGGKHTGTSYKAAGWEFIGYTSGLPKHPAVSMKWDRNDLNNKFVRPTGENRKKIFFKKIG
jgi:hypothetical protein